VSNAGSSQAGRTVFLTWRDIARQTLPPALLAWYRRRRSGPALDFVWNGIYSDVRDAPGNTDAFDSAAWADVMGASAQARDLHAADAPPWASVLGDHALLALLAAIVAGERHAVTVLDFGGGAGEAFGRIRTALSNAAIAYHVVERPAVWERGRQVWAADARIVFHTSVPRDIEPDIVYVSSALQYVEDYAGTLRHLCGAGARYVLLAKLSAGDIPTYATIQQNVPGAAIPYWFLNGGEIVDLMRAAGYRLLFKSALERQYDQSNFPPRYRLGRTCNLLFQRTQG